MCKRLKKLAGPASLVAVTMMVADANAQSFGLPIACQLRSDCHVQQLPDMDPGPAHKDPYCGMATYDGHSGTDIRVTSMEDLARNVPVIASAPGTVFAKRDAMADRLVRTDADRTAVADRECGNGVVIDHGDGWRTQYCHLKLGSIAVREGQSVAKGAVLGFVGASGMAQFPHVHLSISRDGVDLDPFTGQPLDAGCDAQAAARNVLWDGEAAAMLAGSLTQIIAAGFADDAVDHNGLVEALPDRPTGQSQAMVGWVHAINLEAGDRVGVRLVAPDGSVFSETLTDATTRAQASYSAFAGRSRPPQTGRWQVETWIERGATRVAEAVETLTID